MLAAGSMVPFAPPEKIPKAAHKFVLMPDDKVDAFLAHTRDVLETISRPPPTLVLPKSEVLGSDLLAANRRFTFVFTDTGKGDDAVC